MSYSDFLHRLDIILDDFPSNLPDESTRKHLLERVEKLQEKLYSPVDFTMRTVFGSHRAMVLRLAVDMKLFDVIAQNGGVATVSQLAEMTGADEVLIARIARFLTVMNVLTSPRKDTYEATPLSTAFQSSSPLSAGVIHGTLFLSIMSQLPSYFSQTGYKTPSDAYNSPFQFAFRTTDHFFTWLSQSPVYQQAFNIVMSLDVRRKGPDWFDLFPVVSELQTADSDPDRVLIVDIGGGQGRDLSAFRKKFPDLPGRLILQDLPSVVANLPDTLPDGIEIHKYDFFTPQPVKKAKAYFLRTVLHDWPDEQALVILGRVREAMAWDSVLLVNEVVMDEGSLNSMAVQTDFVMMCGFAGMERTEEQFRRLLERAGFEGVRVWRDGEEGSRAVVLEGRVGGCE
ncbi:sterigmatocystin 8-O-methyltransferase precursor [Aspergillus ellipticus CBS 707.79]|uniref:Sterigmatocystin 8-O-methyltransferase n=1 Tax=Aspergillus ellipticus CBS 707.79 TaxID=1448320 RepID=A0A319D6F8_9EURO|nr:sterigmatocystin 8-O-methyltransferase precursor [Aspergillus ellipticus CBS 707.79]